MEEETVSLVNEDIEKLVKKAMGFEVGVTFGYVLPETKILETKIRKAVEEYSGEVRVVFDNKLGVDLEEELIKEAKAFLDQHGNIGFKEAYFKRMDGSSQQIYPCD